MPITEILSFIASSRLAREIIFSVIISAFFELHGRHHVQRLWDIDRAEITRISNIALDSRKAENKQTEKKQAENYATRNRELKNEIDYAHDFASTFRLRHSTNLGNARAGSTSGEGQSGTAETAATAAVLPEKTERDIRQLALEADEVLAQCRQMQSFIDQNRE